MAAGQRARWARVKGKAKNQPGNSPCLPKQRPRLRLLRKHGGRKSRAGNSLIGHIALVRPSLVFSRDFLPVAPAWAGKFFPTKVVCPVGCGWRFARWESRYLVCCQGPHHLGRERLRLQRRWMVSPANYNHRKWYSATNPSREAAPLGIGGDSNNAISGHATGLHWTTRLKETHMDEYKE